jgi:GR25 family glycosyltransferase involved in LPS biosynthesis
MANLNKDYAIVKINDKRIKTQKKIQEQLSSLTQHFPKCVDGKNEEEVILFFKNNPNIKELRPIRSGYLGHWMSFLNILKYMLENDIESLLVLEDDAILSSNFIHDLDLCLGETPDDYDFFIAYPSMPNAKNYLFSKNDVNKRVPSRIKIPEDMKTIHQDWYIGSDYVVKTYQRFGSVGQVFSKKGAKKIIELTEKNGFGTSRLQEKPFDMTIYTHSFEGILNGYQANPNLNIDSLVTINDTIAGTDNETQIQGTKYVHLYRLLGGEHGKTK